MCTYLLADNLMNPRSLNVIRDCLSRWRLCHGLGLVQLSGYGTCDTSTEDSVWQQERKHYARLRTPIHVCCAFSCRPAFWGGGGAGAH